MAKKLRYYLYLSRPPGIGCQPDGFNINSRETWLPAREVDGRYCLGRCGWPQALSPEDVRHYSFYPEDEAERAELVFSSEPDWLKEDYLNQPDELLQEYADRDVKARAALILKRARADASQ